MVLVATAADAAGRYRLPVSVPELLRGGASPAHVLEVTMLALVDRAAATADLPWLPRSEGIIL
jgi:hypothetical protein